VDLVAQAEEDLSRERQVEQAGVEEVDPVEVGRGEAAFVADVGPLGADVVRDLAAEGAPVGEILGGEIEGGRVRRVGVARTNRWRYARPA